MTTGLWGVDSVARATDLSGFDTQNMAEYVRNYWTTTHQYWGRYFGNGPGRYGNGTRDGRLAESLALFTRGMYFIPPINSPGDVATDDYTLGGQQAQAATQDIQLAIDAGHMDLPPTDNHAVYIYLDVEYGSGHLPLNRNYWKGWFDAIRNSYIVSPQYGAQLPMYPAAYANPDDATTMDVLVNTPGYLCWGLWSPNPSAVTCSTYCTIPGVDFSNAKFKAGITAHLWQYGVHETTGQAGTGCPFTLPNPPGSCYSSYPNVDLDESNPAFSMTLFMLQLV